MSRFGHSMLMQLLGLSLILLLTVPLSGPEPLLSSALAEAPQVQPSTPAEEPQIQHPPGAATEPGEVSERGVDVRDYRGSAAIPDVFAQVRITELNPMPREFAPLEPLEQFLAYYRPTRFIPLTNPVLITDVTVEIWHQAPGGQPRQVAAKFGVTLKLESSGEYVRLPANGFPGAPGSFTVTFRKGSATKSRVFVIETAKIGAPDGIRIHTGR